MHLVVTRPVNDAKPLKTLLEARGHRVSVEPLLTIRPRPHVALPEGPFQAIIATSANAIHSLAARPDAAALKTYRMLTVGEASAESARMAGFEDTLSAWGNAESLIALATRSLDPCGPPLLYVTGNTVSRDVKAAMAPLGFTVKHIILYEARPARALSTKLRDDLAASRIDGVVLFSPRTARIWARLLQIEALTHSLTTIWHFCLSAVIRRALAEAANTDNLKFRVAQSPDTQAMIRAIGGED